MSNGISQNEIDALLRGDQEDAPASDPGMMSQDEIQAIMSGMTTVSDEEFAAEPAAPAPDADAAPPEEPAPARDTDAAPDMPAEAPAPMPEPETSAPASDDEFIDSGLLSEMEIDAMGEIGNISMGTAATTLYTLLGHKVDITTPMVSLTTLKKISDEYPIPFVAVEVQYTKGLEGTNIMFLRDNDVKIITDLMMGGDGTNIPEQMSEELHLSAISEVMNQMVGSSSTSLSKLMGVAIDIAPPRAFFVDLSRDNLSYFSEPPDTIVRTSFDMVVEGFINSQIMQVTPVEFAKSMISQMMNGGATAAAGMTDSTAPHPEPEPAYAPPPPPPAAPPPPPPQQYAPPPPPQYGAPPPDAGMGGQAYPQQPYPQAPYPPQPYPQAPYPYPPYPPQPMVDVRPVQFGSFDGGGPVEVGENFDILMDVPLTVSVELGKSSKHIKDILDFNVGTIVVLDKMAGEVVDIVVNGKLIAKGEVVVIDDNYGARITDIVSPSKRLPK